MGNIKCDRDGLLNWAFSTIGKELLVTEDQRGQGWGDRPMEICRQSGGAAHSFLDSGPGRRYHQEEALAPSSPNIRSSK